MPAVSARELRRAVELDGPRSAVRRFSRALKKKWLKPEDFSIKELAESFVTTRRGEPVGRSWVRRLGPQKAGGLTLLESSSGVMLSNFNDITGQIFYNEVMDSYSQASFVGDQLVKTVKTNLNGEKIAGIAGITENVDDIHESMPYPEVGFGPDWIETPRTTKKGLIISVTKETIFFDRTGQVLERAASVGEVLARRKEKDILKMVLGLTNNYKWMGTTYNTYLTTGAWINKKTGLELENWTDIDEVEQLFAEMLDPNTGEPIDINANQILYMPAKRHLFRQILKATTLETLTASGNERRFGPNTLDPYQLIESKFAYRELIKSGVSAANAQDYWIMGQFKKAFRYMENWPITVVQAPNNSEPEFKQDIVLRWKASERGVPAVYNPRYVALVINS